MEHGAVTQLELENNFVLFYWKSGYGGWIGELSNRTDVSEIIRASSSAHLISKAKSIIGDMKRVTIEKPPNFR